MKKNPDFPYYVSRFLTRHMTGIRNLSSNSIKSYKDTFLLLIQFLKTEYKLKAENIFIEDIDKDKVESFLLWLKTDRRNSNATRNQRLTALRSFFKYIQGEEPEYLFHCQKILSIHVNRSIAKSRDYLSEVKIMNILNKPDITKPHGRRDQALLSTLYDSGARVQELILLNAKDVQLDFPCVIKLYGKGRKERYVPLMNRTSSILNNYMKENKLDSINNYDTPLFRSK